MRRLLIPLALLACALAAPSSALAGPPGHWTRITPPTQTSGDQPGYSRTDEDVLHVVWEAQNPANSNHPDLFHTAIAPNGTFIGQNPIETNWDLMSPPALVTAADGHTLEAFFGGIRSGSPSETNNQLNQSGSADRGETWSLVPGSIAPDDAQYASDMSATRLGNVFWQAWGGTGHGAFAHRGTSAATPNVDLQARVGGGCCGYNANIVADPVQNRVFAVWFSNASSGLGVWLQELNAGTSAPIGAPVRMPGTVVTFNGSQEAPDLDDRTPAVARKGGGVWVAYPGGYPSLNRVLLWRRGQKASRKVAKGQADVRGTALAAADDGRLWVAWSADRKGKRRILARRSTKTAGKFGANVIVKPPKGTKSIYAVYADANPNGLLDLLVVAETGAGTATWHRQARPALTLKAPKKVKRKKKTKAKFRVLDAGVPVAGAKVKVAGKTGTTGADGRVKIKIGPFGKKKKSVTAKASKAGYTPAKRKIKIKKK